MKFKLNVYSLLNHCELHFQNKSKEQLDILAKYSELDKVTFSERKLFFQIMKLSHLTNAYLATSGSL